MHLFCRRLCILCVWRKIGGDSHYEANIIDEVALLDCHLLEDVFEVVDRMHREHHCGLVENFGLLVNLAVDQQRGWRRETEDFVNGDD